MFTHEVDVNNKQNANNDENDFKWDQLLSQIDNIQV